MIPEINPMIEVAFHAEMERIAAAKKPTVLYHGSPVDLKTLEAPSGDVGIHLTTQPGLAAPFIIKREDVGGKHGKMRIGQHTWETLRPDDMTIPKQVVVRTTNAPKKRSGSSRGFIYTVDVSALQKKLKPSKVRAYRLLIRIDRMCEATIHDVRLDHRVELGNPVGQPSVVDHLVGDTAEKLLRRR